LSSKQTLAPEVRTLMTGLAMGESPRWHADRLWFSDWGAQEIIAVNFSGESEVVVRVPFFLPFCIDWLPDGRLLIVSGREGLLMRREHDGSLVTHADLRSLGDKGWNEIVVDGRGNVYMNGPGIALLTPARAIRQVADSFAFPNGMAITPDNLTLIIAESHGKKLTAFDIAGDGSLSNRRLWADLGNGVPTASALTRMAPSGTPTFPISDVCASGKVARSCRRSTLTAAVSRACSEVLTGKHYSS
jgi:sugar lactone lactonase YvrE